MSSAALKLPAPVTTTVLSHSRFARMEALMNLIFAAAWRKNSSAGARLNYFRTVQGAPRNAEALQPANGFRRAATQTRWSRILLAPACPLQSGNARGLPL